MQSRRQSRRLWRRTPKQDRARDTIEVILHATAQILDQKGAAALNTNAIAERAGISVGTLYEYFPDKEAVLVALARRQLARDRAIMLDVISAPGGGSFPERVRRAIRVLIGLHAENESVRKVTMATHLAHGLWDEHAEPVRAVADLLAQVEGALPRNVPLSQTSIFVLTRAVVGVVRAAMREQPELLRAKELEDELVNLVEGFLEAGLGRNKRSKARR